VMIELFSLSVTAASPRAKINRKSAFFEEIVRFRANFHVVRDVPREPFLHVYRWDSECLTTLLLTVFIQRNFVADFLQVRWNFTRNLASAGDRSEYDGESY